MVFSGLTAAEMGRIAESGFVRRYNAGDIVFSEGDAADHVYFIRSGAMSVSLRKFENNEELGVLGPGEYFGEMAFFGRDKRSASVTATTEAEVLGLDKKTFFDLLTNDEAIAYKINHVLARRYQELLLKESVLDGTGLSGDRLHISIRGDASLKNTAFTRERFESVVDTVLPDLIPRIEEVLLNRCIYQVYLGFNNGEIRTSSVFDPFREDVHSAAKFVDEAYIDRHFPRVPFEDKASFIRRLYDAITTAPLFDSLPQEIRSVFREHADGWRPVAPREISATLAKLASLRTLPNFYIRNFTISMARDAVRLQFNCDGTHIVSATEYRRFIDETV